MGDWKFIFRSDLDFSDTSKYELPFLFDSSHLIVESDFVVRIIQYCFFPGFGLVYIESFSVSSGYSLLSLKNDFYYRLKLSSRIVGTNRFSVWVPSTSELAI